MGRSILKFEDVSRSYATTAGPVRALRHVDFTLAPKDFCVITGPSGSGKSTLLNLASLLDQPTTGRLQFLDKEAGLLNEGEQSRLRSTQIGMVFQSFHLMPRLTVLNNILFRFRYLKMRAADQRELAEQVAQKVGISHLLQQPARLLSGGEMQRVAIARAIVCAPKLLVADEPTGNLDSHTAERILEQFVELNQTGITVLMVTHNPSLLRYASDHYECCDGVLKKSA